MVQAFVTSAVVLAAVAVIGVPAALGQTVQSMPNVPRGQLYRDNSSDFRRLEASMRPDQDTPQSVQTYQRLLNFADCGARGSSNTLAAALSAIPRSSAENFRFNRLQDTLGGCPGNPVNILSLERGAYSEAMYRAAAPAMIDEKRITATAEDSTKFLDGEAAWNKLRDESDKNMIAATNCLVVVQPGVANKLMFTVHGSAGETAALNELFAKAPTCAGPKPPERLSHSFLRAFIADSLYRLAMSDLREKFLPGVRAIAAK